ncbi:MAG: glycosyltransferase [Chromatiales bacterium]|nr:glycosyltransferase [Chromatiales bacterium]
MRAHPAAEIYPCDVVKAELLFGAYKSQRKGFDLLTEAFARLRGQVPGLELVVFGQTEPKNAPDLGFSVHYCGRLSDDLSLRVLYSAADAMLVPSRQEAFGQTASEALACGTPVIAFDTGWLGIRPSARAQ